MQPIVRHEEAFLADVKFHPKQQFSVTLNLSVVSVTQDLFRPGISGKCFQRKGNLTSGRMGL